MLNISIETIPHSMQSYPTVGWWGWHGKKLTIRVSDMGDWRYEFLVAVHEFCEAMICRHRGIKQSDVDKFDIQFERDRSAGKHSETEEPGDHPKAPYRVAHFIATTVERIMALALCVDWMEYDRTVVSL